MARTVITEDGEENNGDIKSIEKRLERIESYLAAQKTNFDEQEKEIKKKYKFDIYLMPKGKWFGTEYK